MGRAQVLGKGGGNYGRNNLAVHPYVQGHTALVAVGGNSHSERSQASGEWYLFTVLTVL